MNIELKEITIQELSDGFQDNNENGVVGFGGKLDIRPPYQREFIYKDKQRDAVINTITKNFPLNVMYWAVREDGTFEVIDGQQRTISICQYVNGDFAYQNRYFHNLKNDEKEQILNYKLMVYVCSGTESEKLEWFKTINIAGEKLTEQELRNAVYTGSWVSDAKRYFSKSGCVAYNIGGDYLNGSPIRQEFLETAIYWISEDKIENYMATHQHDPNATALWMYFQSVITWVNATFTNKRKKFMKGIQWGFLYNKYKDVIYDTKAIEEETARLIADDEVEKKSGIYAYILTRDERHLGIRTFSDSVKQKVYEKQGRKCIVCKKEFDISEMEGDHITPWKDNGKTTEENCQMLCKDDNRRKSGK
ncbi:HNH endonuclease family protein [Flavobacterium sp.]|uniref:HNH endonuclease family protein n=1 Tax=Flavobacterium sp. TaxID=239 RepID=UPI004048CC55